MSMKNVIGNRMKRSVGVFLLLCLVLALCACQNEAPAAPIQTQPIETVPVQTEPPVTEPEIGEPTTEPQETEPEEPNMYQLLWNGDYYGYWHTFEPYGEYENPEKDHWNCCARIEIDRDGFGTLTLWDEDRNDPEGGLGLIQISVDPIYGTGFMGGAVSESGRFLDQEVDHAAWVIDPMGYEYDGIMIIDGFYQDEGGEFYYEIFLRPWGETWDDLVGTQIELPAFYETWYLPAVSAGASMPAHLLDEVGDGLEGQPVNTITSSFVPQCSDTEVMLTAEEFSEIAGTLDRDEYDLFFLDYADVINTYLHGLEGRIGYVSEEENAFVSYWMAEAEQETLVLELEFHKNEDGIWMYAAHAASSVPNEQP